MEIENEKAVTEIMKILNERVEIFNITLKGFCNEMKLSETININDL